MSNLKIRLRDVSENFIGIVTEYLEAVFTPKWNGVGTWSIKLAGNSQGAQMFLPGCGINTVLPDGSNFSGHATSFLEEWDGSANSGDGTITVSGVEDKAILGYRCVLPTPTADYTQQTAAATYSLNGPAESMIKNLVRYNLGGNALASRKLSGLQVAADQAQGAVSSVSARYDNLLDLVQRIASPIGMGISMVNVPGGWIFDIQVANDVSANVVFSRKVGNLTSYTYGRVAPTITRAIVAGAGAGIARNIQAYDQLGGAVDAIWGFLNEGFFDHRDTNLSSDLLAAANEAFASGGEQRSFSIGIVDTEDIQLGRDYRLGSRVGVVIKGVRYTDIITEISYTSQPNQLRVKPTIGGADAVYGKALDIYRVVKSIAARTALLERRF